MLVPHLPYFFIRTDRHYVRIDFVEIRYFTSADNYVKIHTDTKARLLYHTLREQSWGWMLDQGFMIIQTDRPKRLLTYMWERMRRR